MTSQEIRAKFLKFFKSKGHTIISSASLIPSETDPTVLFTTAGMHPLVPYLLGEDHPGGRRVANSQKCIRTGDIDEVGDESHLTFFEMLGNWSFGDYFKKETIEWSFEFLTSPKWLGIDSKRITITVFEGNQDAPCDEESAKIWQSLGIPKEKIFYKGREDNWWGPAGAIGPCGPDTEMFINGTEIWNDVFMEYNKTAEGKFEPLKQKNVDTGMGLERIAMVMQGVSSVYETDLFAPVVAKIKSQILNLKSNEKSIRIIADHIKASVFIIADGVITSNVGRGYVLRRLIRRAVRHGKLLGIEKDFTKEIAEVVVDIYKEHYPEVKNNESRIMNELENEEKRFKKTLERGLKEFEKNVDPFILFTTYGFPIELTQELAKEKGIEVNIGKFNEQLKQHQEFSRTASAGMFKGGLADASKQTTKYHTATHLLLSGLRKILGDDTIQKGSNITAERLRFDFNYSQKMTDEQIKKVEDLVNQKIQEKIPVEMIEMPKEEALKKVKISFDASKYSGIVKIYKIDDFSVELCGGPHVANTGELGRFKIIKEEASSAGVRRIKAVLE
ncbi:MAG: alanine--tRNA ligase [Candidatus Terrybacteria bacterium]|nr:alanine--tRNA ligase [Candidatus Terrybacteria bacterium]